MENKAYTALITDASNNAAETVAKRLERDGLVIIRNYPDGFPSALPASVDLCVSFDTCSTEDMKALLQWALETIGPIRYLVHTDNMVVRAKIEEISEDEFRQVVNRNAKSAFVTAKVIGMHMAESGQGVILFLSSLHGEKPTGCAFTYSVGKGAVKMLAKELALFYGRKGIRTNLIEMDTIAEMQPLLDSSLTGFNYDIATKIPLGRMTETEDFAGAVSFLLSDDAAFINGSEIRIDGGHLLYYFDR